MSDIRLPRTVLFHNSALKRSACLSQTMYLNGNTDYNESYSILLYYHIPIYSVRLPVQTLINLSPSCSQLLCLYWSIRSVHYFSTASPKNILCFPNAYMTHLVYHRCYQACSTCRRLAYHYDFFLNRILHHHERRTLPVAPVR